MGGAKKKSPAQQEKSQTTKPSDATKKKKQDKEGSAGQKPEISVTLTDEQAMKFLKGSKVITVSELAKQTGVKLSAANAFLQDALKRNVVKRVAGHSGHHLYQPS